jgi:iron complex outermembrane recepter protein
MTNRSNRNFAQFPLSPMAAAIACALAMPATAVQAQESSSTPKLEVVTVTANRRIEKLETVPQSITVLDSAQLERSNVREIDDIINLTPALSLSTGTQVGTNSFNMRGIGTTSNNLGIEGDIAIIIDDMPLAQPQFAFRDLVDLQRVEVLKGPQSTMFGKSAIAGAIYMTTKPIGNAPMQGKVSAYHSSDSEYRFSGEISGKLSDAVKARIFFNKSDFPGLLNNLTTGGKENGSGGETVLSKVEWRVSPDMDVQLSLSASDFTRTGNSFAVTGYTGPSTAYFGNRTYTRLPITDWLKDITPSPTNVDMRLDSPTGLTSKDRSAGLRTNYNFPSNSGLSGFALTGIATFNNNKANDYRDNDSTSLPVSIEYPRNDATGAQTSAKYNVYTPWVINGLSDSQSKTLELRLTSPDEGEFRYLAGLWWSNNALERWYVRGLPEVRASNYTDYYTTTDHKNLAVYANGTWQVAPNHMITAGLRVNEETANYTFTTNNSLRNSSSARFTGYQFYKAPQHEEVATTGRLAYSYLFSQDMTLYSNFATGHKGVAYDMTSGGNNPNIFKHLPLKAETARSIEAGFKANFLNNRATINAAVWKTNFFDYQASTTQTFDDGSSASVLFSVPELQTKGFEIDLKFAATRDLVLSTSYAYTDAILKDMPYGPCYSTSLTTLPSCNVENPLDPNGSRVRNLSGLPMPNSAKNKWKFDADYVTQLSAIPYRAGVNFQYRYQSEVQGNINQNPGQQRPSYSVSDLSFSLQANSKKHKISFGVENLFDKPYADSLTTNIVTFVSTSGTSTSVNHSTPGWKPARDAFRYYYVKLDMQF